MSYDINLVNKETSETLKLNHPLFIVGGTMPAEYDSEIGEFTPTASLDAHINITYNYSNYYYEATDGDERFAHVEEYNGEKKTEYGIRGLYGKTAEESIQLLRVMISRINKKYHDESGVWLNGKREKTCFYDPNGDELELHDVLKRKDDEYRVEKKEYEVSEGDISNYWEATAANAIEALWTMIFIATDQAMNPDAVWDGD